ncbi:MAG: flagellar hook assembly protein FlgD [Nitrosomonas sp.]|nr:flagellar hook assembly protein FlgD [Nitrosomonas sp.]
MSAIQSTNSETVLSATTTGISAKKNAENPQDRFLKLLVTQMKNQDPLKPLDNAEVTSQLAQISTVTGIDKLNSTLQLLTSDVEDSLSVEATGMIGHSVFAPGTSIALKGEGTFGIELAQPVDQLKVTIMDSTGIPIRHMELGPKPSGISTIPWDGKADNGTTASDGNYTFAVSGKQGGQDIKVDTLALGVVKSVSASEKGALLDMGDLGLVNLTDVKRVF